MYVIVLHSIICTQQQKTSARTKPGRIQPHIQFCLQPSESSFYCMTLTYINPRSDTLRLVHLPQASSEHVTAEAGMYNVTLQQSYYQI
jgi:hypothetical protein